MTTLRRPAALLVLLCAAACSPGAEAVPQSAPSGRPLSVEQLAAQVGCRPHIQVDAADMRTGHCRTADGEFFLSTFVSQAGKDAWMDVAPEYNPHLVGPLWTALADRAVLDRLRAKLGGELHLKDHRTGTPGASPT
ncbi:hypothetical protein [Nonomuraea sp. NPDC050310]|uniref:hypothetical protein n=1 Tax=unclassified Nonomuraea TaxID=2593643 RepID=UPI0033C8C650